MLSKRVEDMFVNAFKSIGYTWKSIHLGSFTDVGLECKIPLRWVFDTEMESFNNLLIVEQIFRILDELGMDEAYNAEFDLLRVTNDLQFLEKTEVTMYG